ncbi:MAG TPA: hypothetical protein VG276_03345 [Actinomycetes bacterium]|nr:hypothetical protein [Actinomycetes bacterium]
MTRARLGALLALPLFLVIMLPVGAAATRNPTLFVPRAFVIRVPDVSFEELLSVPQVHALAASGGAALMSVQGARWTKAPVDCGGGLIPGKGATAFRWVCPSDGDLAAIGPRIRDIVSGTGADEVLVVVTSPSSSAGMRAENDELHPIVIATGSPTEVFRARGSAGSLTSDSTRRGGVVTDGDLIPTIADFLGVDPPADSVGSPIEVVEGPPPFELHDRYLAQRRMYVPIGTAGALYVTLMGLLAIAGVWLGNATAWRLRRVVGWGSLSVAALASGLLAAGHLPELSYATVVPFVALVTVFGTLAFAPLEQRDVLLVPAGIGVAVLAFFAIEAVLGWTAALTPFVGGSELDGGRFYGLPNVFVGLLIGSSLWVAQRLRTSVGFALIVAVGLFAGMPFAGANLGGSVSLFAAAGLWLAVRERERLGVWKGIGAVVGVTVLGTAVVLVGHAISPIETHVTRFEGQVGLAGAFERFGDRLRVGLDLVARNPFALVPVIGLPVAIAAVLRPPGGLRAVLERDPAWRDAILVTLLAGVVAYVANDSGPAAAGFAFGLGLGGLLGVSLLSGARKIGEP